MYYYINKKYNRMLYYLLGIYIFLVFVFSSFLYNIISPKAYTTGSNELVKVRFNWIHEQDNNNTSSDCTITYNYSNMQGRAIFLKSDSLEDEFENFYNNSTTTYSGGFYLVYMPVSASSGISASIDGDSSSISAIGDQQVIRSWASKNNSPFDSSQVSNLGMSAYVNKVTLASDNLYKDTYNVSVIDNIQYVTSIDDLYAYLVNGDDSVINLGDPSEDVIDSQIPTPQKVAVYKDSSSPSLVWSNPKGIANNDNINVHIEWKPVITLTHGLYDVHSLISDDYEMLYLGDVGDFNSFCTLNNNGSPPPNVLNSYNTIYDSKVLFSGTGAQQSNDWANYFILKNNVDWVSRVDPFGTNDLFGKGTYSGVRVPDLKYRIRYETENGVSDWIYSDREFGSDNVSGPSQHSSTHSRNASGDPVSNPTYTPNNDNKIIPQNEVDEQDDPDKKKSNSIFDFISGFFDTIISSISSIFEKLKDLVDSISNGTGSFFSFFADLFGAFPQLLGIFLLGLVVTVLLRVLGR